MNAAASLAAGAAAQQLDRYSPGTLLWRSALYAGKDVALVGPAGRVTYADLAERLLDAQADAARAGAPPPSAWPGRALDSAPTLQAVLEACEIFAAGHAAYALDAVPSLAPPIGTKSSGGGAGLAVPRAPRSHAGRSVEAPGFDALALVRVRSGDAGLGWDSQSLCYAWGRAAPVGGSVGAMTAAVGSPISWGSVFGVLIGRGRVVIAPEVASAAWLDAVDTEGVGEVHLDREQMRRLVAAPGGRAPRVRQVQVWHDGVVAHAELAALRQCFPGARISRVLCWAGGPIAVADLEALAASGDRHVGRFVMGCRPVLSRRGELLVTESPCLPSEVLARNGWSRMGPLCRNTGLLARASPGADTPWAYELLAMAAPPRVP